MKNILIIGGLVTLLLIGGVWWSKSLESSDPNVISMRGLHTHPRLAIYVHGEKILIPQNTGVGTSFAGRPGYGQGGMAMTPMHTHDETDGTIHLEFPGRVTREDTKLKNFFTIWGKDMMGFGENVAMTVNGKQSTELGDYEMKDGDIIELKYE